MPTSRHHRGGRHPRPGDGRRATGSAWCDWRRAGSSPTRTGPAWSGGWGRAEPAAVAKAQTFWRSAMEGIRHQPFVHAVSTVTLAIALFTAGLARSAGARAGPAGGQPRRRGAGDRLSRRRAPPAEAGAGLRALEPRAGHGGGRGEPATRRWTGWRASWARLAGALARLTENPLPPSLEVRGPGAAARPRARCARSRGELRADAGGHRRGLWRAGGGAALGHCPRGALRRAGWPSWSLVGATMIIVSATLQLAIYARREEVEIQKLVGATDRFVQAPFLLEGAPPGAGRRGAGHRRADRLPPDAVAPAREPSLLPPACRAPRPTPGRGWRPSSSRWPGRRWGWPGATSPSTGSCAHEDRAARLVAVLLATSAARAAEAAAERIAAREPAGAGAFPPRPVRERRGRVLRVRRAGPGVGRARRRDLHPAEGARKPARGRRGRGGPGPGGARVAGGAAPPPAPLALPAHPAQPARGAAAGRGRGRLRLAGACPLLARADATSTALDEMRSVVLFQRTRLEQLDAWKRQMGSRLVELRAEAEEAAASRPSSARRCSSSRRRPAPRDGAGRARTLTGAAAGGGRGAGGAGAHRLRRAARKAAAARRAGQVEVGFGRLVHPQVQHRHRAEGARHPRASRNSGEGARAGNGGLERAGSAATGTSSCSTRATGTTRSTRT